MLAASPSAGLLTPNATLIAEIIVFLLMVGALWRWVFPAVIRVAEERQKTIDLGLQHAQEAERRLSNRAAGPLHQDGALLATLGGEPVGLAHFGGQQKFNGKAVPLERNAGGR